MHEGLVVGFGEFLEPGGGDEGDGEGGEALDFDYYALAFLDALDGAYGAFEVALGDADSLAGLGDEVGVFEEGCAVVLEGVEVDEVVHLAVGDGEEAVVAVFCEVVGPVVHGLEFGASHLEVGEDLLGGVDEDEAVDGGDVLLADVPVGGFLVLQAHGEEVFELLTVEEFLESVHALVATISNSHWKPKRQFSAVIGGGHCLLGRQRL